MKRLLSSTLFLAVLLVSGSAFSWSVPATELTADGAAWAGAGELHYIYIRTDGTNAVTIVAIYDHATAASGSTLFVSNWVVTTSASDMERIIVFPEPVLFRNGLYFDFTCAGTFAARPYIIGK